MSKRWFNRFKYLFLIAIVIFFSAELIQKYVFLNYYYDYTNGTIVKVWVSSVAQPYVRYTYEVNGKQYLRDMKIDNRLPCENNSNNCKEDYVLVKYFTWNPKVSRVILD